MSAADDAYHRLQAAQRVRSAAEIEEDERAAVSERQRVRIRRRLPKVW